MSEALERRSLLAGNMLVFSIPPMTVNAGSIINSPGGIQVTVENSSGQPITTDTDTITLSLGSNPGAATLTGTVSAAAIKGVATFSTVAISKGFNGYTLVASDSSNTAITSATSANFNVDVIPAFNSLLSLGENNETDHPNGSLLVSGSVLFGTTSKGGEYGSGTVFELSGTNHSVYTTLVSFSGTSGNYPGATPSGSLTVDSAGNLYGTASGGTNNTGVVYELSGPSHSIYTVLASFTGNAGAFPGSAPTGGLTLDLAGNLYGTTSFGGASNYGTVFELSGPNHSTFTSLVSFTGNGSFIGRGPSGTLAIDSSGDLFGSTAQGGLNSNVSQGIVGDGTVYELSGPNHSVFTSLVSFNRSTGTYLGMGPSGLIIDSSGNLYGTTVQGGASSAGTVYELTGANHQFTSLLSFTNASGTCPGKSPEGSLTLDSSGNLYGTTYVGAASNDGTVYELSGANHSTFATLITFTGTTGTYPGANATAGLSLDTSGNLYGTTNNGGQYGDGTVFVLPGPAHNTISPLFQFNPGTGINPFGNVLKDSNGNLYFTAKFGGLYGDGSILELSSPNYSVLTTLLSFTGNSGTYPGQSPGGLTFDSSGNIYGTTLEGGASAEGTIFELSGANHTVFTTVATFTGNSGAFPGASPDSIVFDSNGNIFGATGGGGTAGDGTVFELSGTNHTVFASLVSFTNNTGNFLGEAPNGVIIGADDNLYGTTAYGGTPLLGTAFELSGANHTTFTSLMSFTGTSGSLLGGTPYGNLVADSAGNLYGITDTGGTGQYSPGTVFELSGTNHKTFTTLIQFSYESLPYPGAYAEAGLTMDSSGNLYGTTTGGALGYGELFRLSGTNHTTFSSLVYFTGNAGVSPGYNAFGPVLLDSMGNLFGTTDTGGSYGMGTAYELAVAGLASISQSSGAATLAAPQGAGGAPTVAFTTISLGNGASLAMTRAAAGHDVLTTGSLTLAGGASNWTAQLDLVNNDLDLSGGSIATVVNQIQQGFNAGKWSGKGIISSAAAIDSTHLTALGVIQNNQSGLPIFSATNHFDGSVPGTSDILVKYSYFGDANLSGNVDSADYTLIDDGYLSHGSLGGWFNGDFNYDGVINGSDYTLIDNAFNTQGASLASQIANAAASTDPTKSATPVGVFAVSSADSANSSVDDWVKSRSKIAGGIFSADAIAVI